MEDRSFINLCKDEMIARLDIDPRIVEIFKNVMRKMQAYFNANGYTNDRDYGKFFETYLLDKKFKITFGPIKESNVGGYHSEVWGRIVINEKYINNDSLFVEKLLCHEFIHFLVHHFRSELEIKDKKVTFIDEALTDSLAMQMYPINSGYVPQVSMLEFANLISGNFNNYRTFLKGGVDARYCSSDWLNFEIYANKFQEDFNKAGVLDFAVALNNKNYIFAQRCLIDLFLLKNKTDINFDDYCEIIDMLESRPIFDKEYIDSVIMRLDNKFIDNLKVKDPQIRNVLLAKLKELRHYLYGRRCKGFFEYNGKEYYVDNNNGLYGIKCNMITTYGNGDIKYDSKEGSIITNKSNIKPIEIGMYNKKIKEMSMMFTNSINNDLINLSKARSLDNLRKVEKICIPSMDVTGKKNDKYIYVAICEDKIVVLSENGFYSCGDVDNIDINSFKGFTSTNPNEAGLYIDRLGERDKGLVFSIKSGKNICNIVVNNIIEDLKSKLSPDNIEKIVKDYISKKDDIDDNDDIVYDALKEIAIEQFNSLDESDRRELEKNVSDNYAKFVITMKDGIVDAGYLSNGHVFEGSKEVLYSGDGNGLFDEVISDIPINEIGTNSIIIKTFEGNIDFDDRTHKKILNDVEGLTGISIDPYGGFYYDNELGFPRKYLKDEKILREELCTINKMLERLFNDGKIGLHDYLKMKQEVNIEYDIMIKKNKEKENNYSGIMV